VLRSSFRALAALSAAVLFVACGGDDGGSKTDTSVEDTSVPGDVTDTS